MGKKPLSRFTFLPLAVSSIFFFPPSLFFPLSLILYPFLRLSFFLSLSLFPALQTQDYSPSSRLVRILLSM
jgi:hypothetical protein